MRPVASLLCCLAACGNGDLPPPSTTISDVTLHSDRASLTIHVSPLGFEIDRGGPSLTHSLISMLEVGTTSITAKSYYPDPTDPGNLVTYTKVGNVTAHTSDSSGEHFTVATEDPKRTLTLDVAAEGDGSFSFRATPSPASDIVHVRMHFAADADEHFFGLGEFFDTFDHKGLIRDTHFQVDTTIESGYNERHVPVPAYVSTKGYGVFLDNREPLVADMGMLDGNVHLTVVAPTLAGHLFAMDTPVNAVARMQRIAGLSKLWPAWLFAPMQWRDEDDVTCTVACTMGCKASQTGSDVVRSDVAAMRKLKLPSSLIWLDAPWESGFNDFTMDPVQFPEGKKLITDLNALGYQVAVWASPFIDNADDSASMCGIIPPGQGGASALYDEGKSKGYFVTGSNGTPIAFPWRQTSGAQVDLTNPDAYKWWKSLVHRITDMGVVGFKLDWDEYIVSNLGSSRPDFRFHDGSTVATEHALMHELFHKAHEEAMEESGGPGFILARSGDATDARYASTVWPGDLDSNFQVTLAPGAGSGKTWVGGLPSAVNAAISLAASAHPHYGSDIGGLRHGPPTKECMARWLEFGALSTVMQLGPGHNVWDFSISNFDQELLDIASTYMRLHMSLFPYLYAYTQRNSVDGTPIVRAPAIECPGDSDLAAAQFEYFFGEDLLVAPVVVDQARSRDVVLPAGQWIDWWTGAITAGPAKVTADAPLGILPLYVRAGAIIPLLAPDVDTLSTATDPSVITADMRKGVMGVRVYPFGDSQFVLQDLTSFYSSLTNGAWTFVISAAPLARQYTIDILWKLVGSTAPASVTRQSGAAIPVLMDAASFANSNEGSWYDQSAGILHVKIKALGETLVVK